MDSDLEHIRFLCWRLYFDFGGSRRHACVIPRLLQCTNGTLKSPRSGKYERIQHSHAIRC